MPVAVKIHDHRRVDAHRLQHRLERRRPLWTVRHRLDGVGEMPVGAQRLVSGEGGESIAVGVAQHVRRARLRVCRRTRGKTRPCAGPVPAAHSPTGSTASSRRAAGGRRCPRGRAMSDATDTRGSTRSRAEKSTDAARGTRRRCPLPSLPPAFCNGPAPARARHGSPLLTSRLQRARRVVVRNLRAHVVAGRAIGRRAMSSPGVVVVRDVGIVGRQHRFLMNEAAARDRTCTRSPLRSCPCACRRRAARRGRRCCAPCAPRSVNVPCTWRVPSGGSPDRRRTRSIRRAVCPSHRDRTAARR